MATRPVREDVVKKQDDVVNKVLDPKPQSAEVKSNVTDLDLGSALTVKEKEALDKGSVRPVETVKKQEVKDAKEAKDHKDVKDAKDVKEVKEVKEEKKEVK